jgi:hypothetical protein
MTSDYTKVHFAFEGKKQESDLCLTLLVCKMSLDVAFAKVNSRVAQRNLTSRLSQFRT